MTPSRAPRLRSSRRGQAMVEFAMILPLLALMLVMALDFGRVFFGWIALQNAARIGADLAAQSSDAWPTADNQVEALARSRYDELITADLESANCAFPTPHPDPTFTDLDGDGHIEFGDLASVRLTCSFGLITPLAENLFGGPIDMAASSTFAVNGVVVRGVPDAPPPADPCGTPNASFETDPARSTGGRVNDNDPLSGSVANPFLVDFTANAASTQHCTITYQWAVDGTNTETTREFSRGFTDAPGGSHTDYSVRLTVTDSQGGTASETVTVRVRNP